MSYRKERSRRETAESEILRVRSQSDAASKYKSHCDALRSELEKAKREHLALSQSIREYSEEKTRELKEERSRRIEAERRNKSIEERLQQEQASEKTVGSSGSLELDLELERQQETIRGLRDEVLALERENKESTFAAERRIRELTGERQRIEERLRFAQEDVRQAEEAPQTSHSEERTRIRELEQRLEAQSRENLRLSTNLGTEEARARALSQRLRAGERKKGGESDFPRSENRSANCSSPLPTSPQ